MLAGKYHKRCNRFPTFRPSIDILHTQNFKDQGKYAYSNQVRSLKKYTPKLLIKELKKINFPNYNIFSSVNIAYLDLVEKILNVVDKIAPFKDLRIKNNTQDRFDDEVAKAIKLRKKRLRQFKSTKLHIYEYLFKESKYHAVKLIKQKQSQFYKEKLKENIGIPKELWKALKSLGLPSKKGTILNICLKNVDKICFDDKTNANTFKEFFCNLASDLVTKLPPPPKRFGLDAVHNYYQDILGLLPSKFKFSNVAEDHVLQLLKDMNVDKAAGIDNLSGKFLKYAANILAKPISELYNLSIKYSFFPKDCQIAKLKPLYKKDSTTLPRNYRPILLLPLISKIIEKVIHNQTRAFLDENNILYRFQSGFRKHFTTESCFSYLNNKIATGFESGLHTGVIIIDLQKALTQLIMKSLSIKWNSYDFLRMSFFGLNYVYHIENLRLI